jgi:2-polyprenyl-6-methoxyphenol hydroxylase-like FAD-dependent oxidoreductase
MTDVDVLVVGAGPTGLVHALWLARAGIRVRIIDKAPQPGTASRAVGVAARTLELYRQLGIADRVVAAGWKTPAFNLWVRGERAAHVEIGTIGEGQSLYPFELMYPQGAHERLLIEELGAAGVTVDRTKSLVGFTETEDGVVARLDDGTTCTASYLSGCDGARSAVREALGIGLPGGTYDHLFFVTDLDAGGPMVDGELHVCLDTAAFLAAFPLAKGRARIVGTTTAATKSWDDVAQDVTTRLRLEAPHLRDFSIYHVHHRVADRFRAGRAFLLGDAAHIHSPVGAQGMNTGIGDAVNLAWKLAATLRGAPASLLDSYEIERRAFAEKLVATTDRAFQLATDESSIATFVRTRLVPRAAHALVGIDFTRRAAFRVLGQLEIAYRESPLSVGKGGAVHAGDRLPWVPDNFAPLASRQYQVHVYGETSDALRSLQARVPIHVFPWSEGAGFERDAAYLLRPDGYVAWAGTRVDELEAYLTKWQVEARS